VFTGFFLALLFVVVLYYPTETEKKGGSFGGANPKLPLSAKKILPLGYLELPQKMLSKVLFKLEARL